MIGSVFRSLFFVFVIVVSFALAMVMAAIEPYNVFRWLMERLTWIIDPHVVFATILVVYDLEIVAGEGLESVLIIESN
jgi:hypothetical protein